MPDFIQFLLRFSLFALIHSILAMPSLKKQLTGRSRHLSQFYRLYYNVVSLMLFGWVMIASTNSTVLFFIPGVWSLLMYFMQLVFIILLVVCVRQTGASEFLGIASKSQEGLPVQKLVTHGWYGVVRHPLYLLSMLFLLSNPVISIRSILLTLMSAVYFLVGARLEESRLLLEFGREYQAYQDSVPFILPRFSKVSDSNRF